VPSSLIMSDMRAPARGKEFNMAQNKTIRWWPPYAPCGHHNLKTLFFIIETCRVASAVARPQ
jgi:hypothetical protein